MITVGKVLENNKDTQRIVTEQAEEVLKTGEIKAVKKSYTPYVLLGIAAILGGIWLWKHSKNNDGTIPG